MFACFFLFPYLNIFHTQVSSKYPGVRAGRYDLNIKNDKQCFPLKTNHRRHRNESNNLKARLHLGFDFVSVKHRMLFQHISVNMKHHFIYTITQEQEPLIMKTIVLIAELLM